MSLVQASLCSRLLGKCLLEIACSVPGTPGSQGVVESPRLVLVGAWNEQVRSTEEILEYWLRSWPLPGGTVLGGL